MEVAIIAKDESLIPNYSTMNSAGADLRAHIEQDILVEAGTSYLVPTGIFLEVPEGFEAQIRPRSGLALKNLITVLNAPGTIDSDYRGEVLVILMNHGKKDFIVKPKMRIAQLVLSPFVKAKFIKKKELSSTKRGGQGFGHTGTN